MTFLRTILIAMAATATLSSAVVAPASAAPGGQGCWTDQETQAAIANGEIQTWSKIRKLGGVPSDYYVTADTPICVRNGVPYYVVSMTSPKGEQIKIVLNAVDGSS